MKGTLTGRLALVQTGVTLTALAVVMLGTFLGLTALLTWKADQHVQSATTRIVAYLEQGSRENLGRTWLLHELDEVRPHGARVEIRDSLGAMHYAAGEAALPPASADGCETIATRRICSVRSGPWLIQVGRLRSDDLAAQNPLMLALALVSMLAGAGVALTSRIVTQRALRPFSDVAQRVAAIEPGSGERVELQTGFTEVDTLAERFNEVVARFEEALSREKRFVAQASHELRTPLTVARAEIEALLQPEHPRGGPERALSALERLTALIDTLLWFARAQGRLDDERMDIVNVADLIRNTATELRLSRPARSFSLRLPEEALVRGDETLLGRAVSNLLENAVKYGADSTVRVELERTERELGLHIANGGPPIAHELQEQIFLPFVRGDVASEATNGFGLGLPFARAVARAHGGDVLLTSSSAQRGTEVALRLPLVAWSEG